MKPVKLDENIYWVGAIDWNIRDFHGYLTQRGTTYNSYLIIDDKITLIDTVKHCFADEMLQRISAVIDPSKIDYVITNHIEMDQSGSLPNIISIAPNAKIFISPNGEKGLQLHYKNNNWDIHAVKPGETLNIGKRNITFAHTPMIHWPDNMIGYLAEQQILFSNDAFGQHIASSQRFDHNLHLHILLEESAKYYANIVLPYSSQVQKALESVSTLNIKTIAPSHGIIWQSNIPDILKQYQKWSNNQTDNTAIIVYDSMWDSTTKMAYSIQSAFEAKGIATHMFNLKANHISDIMTSALTAKYICVGSPTLNNNMMPTVSAFLCYLKGLSPKNRMGLAFGSYGWSGQSIGLVDEWLKSIGCDTLEPIKIQYIPDNDQLQTITKSVMNII